MLGLQQEAARANAQGRYRRATALEERALRRLETGDLGDAPVVRARVLITSAMTQLALAGRTAALGRLAEALDLVGPGDRSRVQVLCDLQAGAIHVWCSEWAQARVALERVMPHLDDLTPQEECAALINLGLTQLSTGELAAGRRVLSTAVEKARIHRLMPQEFKARHNLGCLEYISGDLPAALRLLRQARALGADVATARTDIDLGEVLLEAGLLDEAAQTLTAALRGSRTDASGIELGEAHLLLARCALIRLDLDTARHHAGLAARAFRSRDAAGRAESARLLAAYLDILRDRVGKGSRETLARAVEDGLRDPANADLLWRAQIERALQRGDAPGAASLLAQGGRVGTGSVSALSLRLLRARVALALGDRSGARRQLVRAALEAGRTQGASNSLDMRSGYAVHTRRLRELDLGMAHETGRVDVVFGAAERWRAVSLRTTPARVADPESRELVSELRRTRRALSTSAATEESSLRARADQLEAAVLEREREVLESRTRSVRRLATLAGVRRALGPASLCAFHELGGVVYRVDVGPRAAAVHEVGSLEDLSALVARLAQDLRDLPQARAHPSIAALVRQGIDRSAGRLGRLLLAGLPGEEGPLVVVPTRVLHAVPWGMMPPLSHRPVVVAPSATAWAAAPCTVLGPDLEPRFLRGPGLRHAAQEIALAARAWGPTPGRQGGPDVDHVPPATAADLADALSRYEVAHLATHGTHEPTSPLFSALHCADGPFFAHEIPAGPAAKHVILSACEVGMAHIRPGDEPLGFAAVLLANGVRSVIAAVAPVPDDATAALMVAYHQRLRDGVPASVSLRAALDEVPDAGAFCLFGADVRVGPTKAPGLPLGSPAQMKSAGSRNNAS